MNHFVVYGYAGGGGEAVKMQEIGRRPLLYDIRIRNAINFRGCHPGFDRLPRDLQRLGRNAACIAHERQFPPCFEHHHA